MSNSLKNKIYNYEETPPSSAWEKVAMSLDEKLLNKNTLAQLYNQEEIPPTNTWNNISTALDAEIQEAKFRNEVLEEEATPPPFTWNKIAKQLDAEPLESFSKKVQAYEVAPPVQTWEKITAVLDAGEKDVPVISIQKSYSKILRIAAAAVVIGILAWAGFNMIDNGKTNKENNLANNEIKNIQPTPPVVTTNPPLKEQLDNNPTNENDNPSEFVKPVTTKKVIKNIADNQDEPLIAATDTHASSEELTVTSNKTFHKRNKPAPSTDNNQTEARYLVYLTEKGEMVNLSKKLIDLTCIYTKDGSVSQQALAQLDASACNDQVKYWQEKMANSSLQSSSNPLELIEVLR